MQLHHHVPEQKAINISTTHWLCYLLLHLADGRDDLFTKIHAQYFAAGKKCIIAYI
jgi:hypothetical protein